MSATFVSCWYDIYPLDRINNRLEQFLKIAKVSENIKFHVFVCSKNYPTLRELGLPNVYITELKLIDTDMYRDLLSSPKSLPEDRSPTKDTVEYMILMNAKIEFVKRARDMNPWGSSTFVWIDFSIAYLFRSENTVNLLESINNLLQDKKIVAFPGCWEKDRGELSRVCWRFCGSLFICSGDAVQDLYNQSRLYAGILMTDTLLWEVNLWALVDRVGAFDFGWYYADHNDTLFESTIQLLNSK